jgi:hypothetical protein
LPKFVAHIEELRLFLDSLTNPEAMKKRMDSVIALLEAKGEDVQKPTRAGMSAEASFMLKNKDRITKAIGTDDYIVLFGRIVTFLEKNPPERKKKLKKKVVPEGYQEASSVGAAGGTIGNTVAGYIPLWHGFELERRGTWNVPVGTGGTIRVEHLTHDAVEVVPAPAAPVAAPAPAQIIGDPEHQHDAEWVYRVPGDRNATGGGAGTATGQWGIYGTTEATITGTDAILTERHVRDAMQAIRDDAGNNFFFNIPTDPPLAPTGNVNGAGQQAEQGAAQPPGQERPANAGDRR